MNIFLIDADNLNSGPWIDEAFAVLLQDVKALQVRRAYGSAENLKALTDTWRTWAVRPFVNLALSKNTTDLALAVDAMELACQNPAPELIVIGSGDADFTPLVVRLRERGIRVQCVSERSKMSREAEPAYDQLILVGQEAAASKTPPARKRAIRKTNTVAQAVPGAAEPVVPNQPSKPAAKTSSKRGSRVAVAALTTVETGTPQPQLLESLPVTLPVAASNAPDQWPASTQSTTKKPRKTPIRRSTVDLPTTPTAPTQAATPSSPSTQTAASTEAPAILAALPALQAGQPQALNEVAKALRDAGLLGKNASSLKLLRKHPTMFELLPHGQPHQVRLIST